MAVFDDVISSPLLTDGFALHMFVSFIHQLIVFDPSTGNILIITIYSGCDKCCRKPNTVTLFTNFIGSCWISQIVDGQGSDQEATVQVAGLNGCKCGDSLLYPSETQVSDSYAWLL